ncbi:unnamed protein product [Protopolystoma xenopodis]|uniref:Uncharacterized protein n=1 Tax=Protopolystoma xenopodis TaxID=117903 RepID=A0A448WLF0_9PLAT|nr:unnamed protein product [Protopolystoma xenopodis]
MGKSLTYLDNLTCPVTREYTLHYHESGSSPAESGDEASSGEIATAVHFSMKEDTFFGKQRSTDMIMVGRFPPENGVFRDWGRGFFLFNSPGRSEQQDVRLHRTLLIVLPAEYDPSTGRRFRNEHKSLNQGDKRNGSGTRKSGGVQKLDPKEAWILAPCCFAPTIRRSEMVCCPEKYPI